MLPPWRLTEASRILTSEAIVPKSVRTTFLLFILTAASPTGLLAQTDQEAAPTDLDQQMDDIFFEWNRLDRPGGSIAVVHAGEVVYLKSFGLASLELGVPNTNRTLYDVVSLAEPFTITAVAKLVGEGRLSFEDDIRTYLTEMPVFDPPVRVRHLTDHTSGLWDWRHAWHLSGGLLEDVITLEQIIDMLCWQSAPVFMPGSRHEYSASNPTLLAEIVARVTEQPFRDWLWENVLRPAGMIHCVVRDRPGESIAGSAEAYDYQPHQGYRRGSLNMAAPGTYGLYASIEDIAKWLANLTATTDVADLLDAGVLEDGTPSGTIHGLRWDSHQGVTRYYTDGQWQGYNMALQIFPEQRFGVVILCNWVSRWVNPVSTAGQIANLYLADAFAAADADAASTAATELAQGFTPDPSRYGLLTGDYRWEPGDVFAIVVQNDRLAYQQGRNQLPMTQLAADRFVLDNYPYFFTFTCNAQGQAIQCLIEHEGDADVTAPRIELVTPSPDELELLVGEYESQLLDTEYVILLEDESLVLSHARLGQTALAPEAADHFTATGAPFRMLEFVRDDHGQVVGFRTDTMKLIFQKRD
jgi:CubicO group peptidase (beta-lactamase class C family)